MKFWLKNISVTIFPPVIYVGFHRKSMPQLKILNNNRNARDHELRATCNFFYYTFFALFFFLCAPRTVKAKATFYDSSSASYYVRAFKTLMTYISGILFLQ